jgi:long-chain acyl-CoA synthetase
MRGETIARNRRLPDFKRVGAYLLWERDFPRTTYLKIRRDELAEQIGKGARREAIVEI